MPLNTSTDCGCHDTTPQCPTQGIITDRSDGIMSVAILSPLNPAVQSNGAIVFTDPSVNADQNDILPFVDTITPNETDDPTGKRRIEIPITWRLHLRVIDSNDSRENTMEAGHQYVTINGVQRVPESGELKWDRKPDGSYYPAFYIEIPVGVSVYLDYLPVTA